MPFHKVGTHRRRVCYDELMAYKRRENKARRQALDELAYDHGQKLGLGY